MSEMNLTTVRLRAMEPEDLDFLYNIENDRELWNVGNTNVPYSRYVLHDYIANATNDIYSDGQVRMIVENAEGCTVGMADLFDFNATLCTAYSAPQSGVCRHLCRQQGVDSPFREMWLYIVVKPAKMALRWRKIHRCSNYE